MNLTERDLRDKYEKIKTNLNLDGTIWEDIDVELLLLAFTHSSGEKYIPQSISDDQYNKYASNNYEWFEFIGDAVLEMIITTIMTEIESVEILRNAHLFRQELVRNLTLYCYMTRRGLCKEIIKDPKVKYEYKMCADMFEALMGIFYWWGYYIKGMGYTVLEDIREWMTQNWYLQESLDSLLKSGEVIRLTLSNSSLPLRARNKLLKSSLELQKYPTTYNDTRSYIYPIIKSLYHSN